MKGDCIGVISGSGKCIHPTLSMALGKVASALRKEERSWVY